MRPATGLLCWAERRVILIGTIDDMLQSEHPWIREYFHGPRARARPLLASRADPDDDIMEIKSNNVLIGTFALVVLACIFGFALWISQVQLDRSIFLLPDHFFAAPFRGLEQIGAPFSSTVCRSGV